MAIISADQFRAKAFATIAIPGFVPGETFDIQVKRLSLVGLISSGKIPNALMASVKEAFAGIHATQTADEANPNDVSSDVIDKAAEIGKLTDIICREAMVSPTFEEVRDVMSDEQKLAVFEFTQGGVNEVRPFPEIEGNTRHTTDVEDISGKTE